MPRVQSFSRIRQSDESGRLVGSHEVDRIKLRAFRHSPMRNSLPLYLASMALGALAACGDTADPAPTGPRPVSDARLPQSEVEKLRELGYSDFSLEEADANQSGVVLYDADRSQPGYNLVSLGKRAEAILVDAQGKLVHSWRDADGRNWDHVELCDDGDLLVVGSSKGQRKQAAAACEDHYLARYAWDGSLRWKSAQSAHHDVQFTPRGQLVTLTATQRHLPRHDSKHDVIDNAIEFYDDAGRRLRSISLCDLLAKAPQPLEFLQVKPNPDPRFPIVDLIHANSVEWMSRTELYGKHPIFAPQNILVCMRHQDAIVVVDVEAEKIVWSWGRDEISGAHDARVLDGGRILVYDNGLDRGWSRVIEVDPWTGKIVWEYRAPDPKSFFSSGQGSSQRLANGNTLVANSLSGQAFEVTTAGERVWEYLVPHFDDKGRRATMYRIRRYAPEYVERFLAQSR